MRLCNDTITVFNAKLDQSLDSTVYIPTVIKGVSWYGSMKSMVDASGLKAARQYTIRIPAAADTGGRVYVDPAQYKATNGDTEDSFTLNEGDLIVKGAVSVERLLPSQIKDAGSVTILAVTDNRRAPNAPHWKVTCA